MLKNQPEKPASMNDAKSIEVVPPKQAVLYRLRQTKNWYCRIKYADQSGYWKGSTGTSDLEKAKIKAIELNLMINSSNGDISKLFRNHKAKVEAVAKEFLKKDTINKNDKTITENHIIPKLGKLVFSKLRYNDIEEYIKSCNIKSESTFANHTATLSKLFRFAVQNEYIESTNHLSLDKKEFKKNFSKKETDIVTPEEWDTIFEHGKKWKSDTKKIKVYEIRHKLFVLIQFLLFTGIRPGNESEELQYKDIEFFKYKDKIVGFVDIKKGKMKDIKPRRIPINEDTAMLLYLELHFQCFEDLPKVSEIENDIDRMNKLLKLNPERKIFYTGEKRPEYARNFSRLINFLRDEGKISKDKNFILYSFRHTYITNELYKKNDIYEIAKHCGTSVAMIEKFYSKYETMINAKKVFESGFNFYKVE
jgi:integrase